MNMYRINPFVRVFERNNIKALFNTLTLKTLYLTDEVYNNLLRDIDSDLIKEGFIVPPEFEALSYFTQNHPRQKDRNISVAYFFFFSICNFRCKYCFF